MKNPTVRVIWKKLGVTQRVESDDTPDEQTEQIEPEPEKKETCARNESASDEMCGCACEQVFVRILTQFIDTLDCNRYTRRGRIISEADKSAVIKRCEGFIFNQQQSQNADSETRGDMNALLKQKLVEPMKLVVKHLTENSVSTEEPITITTLRRIAGL